MDHNGDFSDADPQWNARARLEEAVLGFCSKKFNREVGLTTLRDRLPAMLEAWRATKIGN